MATIVSPAPGVFYRKPSPDREPFVNVGDTVTAGQKLAMIEIMKQFIDVRSTQAGKIVSILAEDATSVKPGQDLFVMEEQ